MGFLAPWFLGGMLAVGLPLYLHLLRQHKTTPLAFSSLMFFERRTQSSIKHRRLRHLLLLALRMALIVLLALAFAQPFKMRDVAAAGSSRKLVVVALDDSFSMRAAGRMERAKQGALSLLSNVRPDGQYQVMSVDAKATLLTQPTGDAAVLRAAVASVEAGDFRSSYAEFARALRSAASSSGLPVEAHLFTDAQRTSMPAAFSELALAPNTSLTVHSVAERQQPNWTVETVSAPSRIFVPSKAHLDATIAGYGTEKAQRKISLVVNGQVRESKDVELDANGKANVQFLKLDVPYGFNRCEIRLEPDDVLPADDRFYFSVERSDPKKILFVYDGRKGRVFVVSDSGARFRRRACVCRRTQPLGPAAAATPGSVRFCGSGRPRHVVRRVGAGARPLCA